MKSVAYLVVLFARCSKNESRSAGNLFHGQNQWRNVTALKSSRIEVSRLLSSWCLSIIHFSLDQLVELCRTARAWRRRCYVMVWRVRISAAPHIRNSCLVMDVLKPIHWFPDVPKPRHRFPAFFSGEYVTKIVVFCSFMLINSYPSTPAFSRTFMCPQYFKRSMDNPRFKCYQRFMIALSVSMFPWDTIGPNIIHLTIL